MKKLRSEKGAITILVLVSMLFMVSFLISSYIIVSNKIKTQKEIIAQTKNLYENYNLEEIYNSYFGKNIIPIYTPEQFKKIGTDEYVNIEQIGKRYKFSRDAHYVLMNDIDFTNTNFEIICEYNSNKAFSGILDGLGNTIKGIKADVRAIIGENSGTIQNIVLENITIDTKRKEITAVLVGKNTGTVQNINIKNDVSIQNNYNRIGGVVGYNVGGTIQNCENNGTISASASNYVGGIAGQNTSNGIIQNCDNNANITGKQRVGGIAGQNNATISNCNNSGIISGLEGYTGGIVGWNEAKAIIKVSYNEGEIKASGMRIGGVTGLNLGNLELCYNKGTILVEGETSERIGGITGDNQTNDSNVAIAEVTKCYNEGEISIKADESHYIGGIAGINTNGEIKQVFNKADLEVSNYTDVGGIVGNNTGNVICTYNIAKIIGKTSVGGIVGGNQNTAKISRSYNVGDIKGENEIGGIAGRNVCLSDNDNDSNKTINNCYNCGNIHIQNKIELIIDGRYAGGVAGINYGGYVENCCNTGTVEGFGGIVGRNLGTVTGCYNKGVVGKTAGEYMAGGIVGVNGNPTEESDYEKGDIKGCYNYACVYGNAIKRIGLITSSHTTGTIEECYYLESLLLEEDCAKTGIGGKNDEDGISSLGEEYMPDFPELMSIIQGEEYNDDVFKETNEYPIFTWQ